MMLIIFLAVLGFCISLYGFFIEQKLKTNPDYKPLCDISEKASCTKPIASPMGKIFWVSNTIMGMLFYASIIVLAYMRLYQLIVLLSSIACLVSLYLAYILFFHIKTVCLICTLTYLINAALLVISIVYVV
jgi:vitamin-K-epoxide reductase (warfarin-sensitive)